MGSDDLSQLYRANDVVAAVCDHMARRKRNQTQTYLHRIVAHLAADGHDFKQSEVIAAFRALESVNCGKYVEGRHGYKSRFVWSVQSSMVASAAKGIESEEALQADGDDEEYGDDALLEHSYNLRADLVVSLELPASLTPTEAKRLAQFVSSLSFEDDELEAI